MSEKLDGNAAAGMLEEVFPFEMTTSIGTCAHCGTTNEIGAFSAYMSAMGTVIRCSTCEGVLLRIVHTRDEYWLDMQGLRALRMKANM